MAWQPDYATSAELKHYLRIPDGVGADTADDAELGLALAAASRALDRSCSRQFGSAAASVTRYYTARWDRARGRYLVDIDDLHDATGLAVASAGSAVAATDYTLLPRNAPADGRPYTQLVFTGTVSCGEDDIAATTDKWGWAAVPATIKEASLLQAARLVKRRDAPFGVAGSPELGNELRLLARLDPDVEVLVGGYRRWWGAK